MNDIEINDAILFLVDNYQKEIKNIQYHLNIKSSNSEIESIIFDMVDTNNGYFTILMQKTNLYTKTYCFVKSLLFKYIIH